MEQSYLVRWENCDVRIESWEARDIQLETLDAVRECMLKWVAWLKRAGFDDDVEEESYEEVILDACYFPYHFQELEHLRRGDEQNAMC